MNVLVENSKGEQHLRSRFLLKIGKSGVDVAPSRANFPVAHGWTRLMCRRRTRTPTPACKSGEQGTPLNPG